MGVNLHSTFIKAGLSAPTMRHEALIGRGERASSPLQLMAALAPTLLPAAERLGVDTHATGDTETLLERMTQEVQANNSLIVGLYQIGAWSQVG